MRKLFAVLSAVAFVGSIASAAIACPGDKSCDGSKCDKAAAKGKHHHAHAKGAKETESTEKAETKPATAPETK